MSSKKTPVSILHEYCMKKAAIPNFQLLAEVITENMEPKFTFEINLFDEHATGSGSNKKAAKHETALALLQLLAEKDTALNEFLNANGLGDHNPIETPYAHHNVENCVGKLENLVLLNNLPNPVYKQRYEEGMDHAKKFTWTCKLGYLSVEASHRTKKQAKHTSALLMIDNLEKELGDSFKTTIPEDFKVDYKDEDLVVERKKVRAHLLGCKVLAKSTANSDIKFSPVVLSKLHRVITEPYLEVTATMQDIFVELEMTADQFNDFLDDENLASLEKLCDIINKVSEGTGIDIQFVNLLFGADQNNDYHIQNSQIGTETRELDPVISNHSDFNVIKIENTLSDIIGDDNNQTSQIGSLTEEIDPGQSGIISGFCEININEKIVSCDNSCALEQDKRNSTDNNSESSSLAFVMCKVLIVPAMHFLGIAPTYEESTRKAAILFLKHINSLKTDPLRKQNFNFMDDFSSGDET